MRRLLVAIVCLLLAPSAASAATAQVSPGGLQGAIDGAEAGDTLALRAGDFEAATVPAAKTDLVLDGSAGARLVSGLTVQATGTTLRSLVLAPGDAVPAGVQVDGSGGATLDHVLATRTGGALPLFSSAGRLSLLDVSAFNVTGPVASLSGSTTRLVRSTLVTLQASADAVGLSVSDAGARSLTADSSILVGGAGSGAGVRVGTSGVAPLQSPGDVTAALRHVTIAGSKAGVVLDSAGAQGNGLTGPVGSIAAKVTGSIVHAPSSATPYAGGIGGIGGGGANSAALSFADSDGPGAQTNFTDAQVFGRSFHLLSGAPVIDRGGPLLQDESTTDVDGQLRTGPTDAGADEFSNRAPSSGLTIAPNPAHEGQTVTFASSAVDPDAGDGGAAYAWDFGDGTARQKTSGPTTTHVYARAGAYTAIHAVIDRNGALSPIASQTVTVVDSAAPAVSIRSPRDGSRRKYGKHRRLTAKGADADSSGVARVEVALTLRRAAKGRRGCRQYTGRHFTRRSCKRLSWRKAKLVGTGFKLVTRKRVRLVRGRYELRVRATDAAGNRSAAPAVKRKTLSRFRVR